MPYKSEKIKIANTQYDRRIKLTDEQRKEIREKYATGTVGHRPLAKEYGVSRSLIRLVVDEEKVRAQMKENAKKPRKKSGFMARLEEAQRQQQAMLREQQKRKGKK